MAIACSRQRSSPRRLRTSLGGWSSESNRNHDDSFAPSTTGNSLGARKEASMRSAAFAIAIVLIVHSAIARAAHEAAQDFSPDLLLRGVVVTLNDVRDVLPHG